MEPRLTTEDTNTNTNDAIVSAKAEEETAINLIWKNLTKNLNLTVLGLGIVSFMVNLINYAFNNKRVTPEEIIPTTDDLHITKQSQNTECIITDKITKSAKDNKVAEEEDATSSYKAGRAGII